MKMTLTASFSFFSVVSQLFSMQQGKMFFIMGLCMALVQGGYVRRIPHGKEMIAAMNVSIRKTKKRLINSSVFFL